MHTLEKRLNYTFENKELLERALYHSSYANEHRGGFGSNERLEFLGDAVLGMVTADYLFHRHPDLPEGDLTRIRAALVCEQSLHEVAQRLGLGEYIKLGHGEELGGGRKRPSILADATEAVFAAVYHHSLLVGTHRHAIDGASVQVQDVLQTGGAVKRYEPHSPLADANGDVWYPDVNVVEQMADMMSASRDFETNVDVLNNVKSMQQSLLKLGEA